MASDPRATDEPLPFGRLLLLGLRAFVGLMALALLVGVVVSAEAGMGTAIAVGVVLLIVETARFGGEMFAAVMMAIFVAAGVAVNVPGVVEARRGGEAAGISVAEAPSHPEATRFTFRDGEARPTLKGSFTERLSKGQSRTYAAMPVVPAGWRREEPVPLWVACVGAGGKDAEAWAAVRAGVRVGSSQRGLYERAVGNAMLAHKLTAAPGAPVLSCGRAEEIESERLMPVKIISMVMFGAWVAGVLVYRWREGPYVAPRRDEEKPRSPQ